MKLRPWQIEVTKKCLNTFTNNKNNKFLINAAPGAGKTMAACAIAVELFKLNKIEKVITIAPRSEVVSQWAKDFHFVTGGRSMTKITSKDAQMSDIYLDVCATWTAVEGLKEAFNEMCNAKNTLVICDELHHAAIEAVWGKSAYDAFVNAKYILMLTGTPIRSDGNSSVWLGYDNKGRLLQPLDSTYTLTYGQAIDFGYCRPVTFHRHEGKFSVSLDEKTTVNVSSHTKKINVPKNLEKLPGLKQTLNFYKLACTPQYENNSSSPLIDGYQGSMIEAAAKKLYEVRNRLPNAGALVIAPSIQMANYIAELIELIESEKPIVVHSEASNAEAKIKLFREGNQKWLVSVAMVSEGIDIPRLRVLTYLPYAMTELAFRQAIGRIVRSCGIDDDSCGHVILPQLEIFNRYAKRIEEEIPEDKIKMTKKKTKKCLICKAENKLNATSCHECGAEFPKMEERQKDCQKCEKPNPISQKKCLHCGHSFEHDFKISLDEALRDGAISRGSEFSEEDAQKAEQIAPGLRDKLLKSGDEKLLRIIKQLPDISMARLKVILSD